MENADIYCGSQVQLPAVNVNVKVIESVLVPPSQPPTKTILYLSNLDDHLLVRVRFDIFLVYNNGPNKIYGATNPVKVIREALSQVLSYYYPLAGRVRRTKDGGKLEINCTGEGALFVEAFTDHTLSILGEIEELKLSFQQLLFRFPLTAKVEEVPPLILQVTRFHCGSFVVGLSFNHSVCDGRGAAQFLNGLAEIARGEAKLSVEPVWQREDLKPQQPYLVRFVHDELLESGYLVNHNSVPMPGSEDLVFASFLFKSDAIQRIKQPIVEELKEHCTTFEILAALAWRARTRVLGIPLNHAVRLLFPVDVRRAFKDPLAEGYYGNSHYMACARSGTAEEVVNGPFSDAVKMIKKAKTSLNEEFLKSSIAFLETKREIAEVPRTWVEDTYLSDWRWLGFNKVDFGWGEPVNAHPGNWIKVSPCPIGFMLPPKNNSGVMLVFCVPHPALKALETEMHSLGGDW